MYGGSSSLVPTYSVVVLVIFLWMLLVASLLHLGVYTGLKYAWKLCSKRGEIWVLGKLMYELYEFVEGSGSLNDYKGTRED